MEAIMKFTNSSIRREPKIGLLVGPPGRIYFMNRVLIHIRQPYILMQNPFSFDPVGTGKSKVIANLVTQILYGDARYVNRKMMRILVCAPSNAAIDEIVLRLLDIRQSVSKGNV